jgi:hypothetical protein
MPVLAQDPEDLDVGASTTTGRDAEYPKLA